MGLYENFPYTNFHDLNQDWILQQLKSVDDKIAQVNSALEKLDEYTTAFNQLSEMYYRLEGDFEAFKYDVNTQLSNGIQDLNNRFNEQVAYMNSLYASFTVDNRNMITALQAEITSLDNLLQQVITNLEDSIILFNPLTGEENTLQQIIYYLASLHMGDALTATEYDALDLTATAYDAYAITAYQYDSEGRTLLV